MKMIKPIPRGVRVVRDGVMDIVRDVLPLDIGTIRHIMMHSRLMRGMIMQKNVQGFHGSPS